MNILIISLTFWPSHNGSTPESIEVSVTHSDHWQFKEWKDGRRRVGDEKSTKDVFAWRVLCRGSGSVLWVIPFMFCCEKFKQQKYKEEHTPVCVWLANEASLKDVWAEPGSVSLQTTSYFPLTTNLEIQTQCSPCELHCHEMTCFTCGLFVDVKVSKPELDTELLQENESSVTTCSHISNKKWFKHCTHGMFNTWKTWCVSCLLTFSRWLQEECDFNTPPSFLYSHQPFTNPHQDCEITHSCTRPSQTHLKKK